MTVLAPLSSFDQDEDEDEEDEDGGGEETEARKTKTTTTTKAKTKTKTDKAQVCTGFCHWRDGGTVGFHVLSFDSPRRPVFDK